MEEAFGDDLEKYTGKNDFKSQKKELTEGWDMAKYPQVVIMLTKARERDNRYITLSDDRRWKCRINHKNGKGLIFRGETIRELKNGIDTYKKRLAKCIIVTLRHYRGNDGPKAEQMP